MKTIKHETALEALDALFTSGVCLHPDQLQHHLKTCESCGRRFDHLAQVARWAAGGDQRAGPFELAYQRALKKAARFSGLRLGLLGITGVLVAATLWFLQPSVPPPVDTIRLKGQRSEPIALLVQHGEHYRSFAPNERLRAGDLLAFQVSPSGPTEVAIAIVDDTGGVHVLTPQRIETAGRLKAGIRLDAQGRVNRIIALLTTQPLPAEQLEEALRATQPWRHPKLEVGVLPFEGQQVEWLIDMETP